jgi:hypothetical protein
MRREFPLIEREKAVRRRDAVDAFGDQLVCGIGKALKQVAIVERVDDLVRQRAVHDLVLHRKRPGLRIANVAVETLKFGVEHQDADPHPVVGPLGGAAPNRSRMLCHGRAAYVSEEPMAAEASVASNSPVRRS